jgi:two-component system OmpR family response regulator
MKMQSSVVPPQSVKRILIIEDDPAVYKAIKLLLDHYGFSVTVATTIRDACVQIAGKYDLIVLDVMLPDGSGLDLLQRIRYSCEKSVVYVLTGNTLPDTDRKIRRLMPDKHFHKPFNFYDILNAIRLQFGLTTDEPAVSPLHLF